MPAAATVKLAACPAVTVRSTGCGAMVGATAWAGLPSGGGGASALPPHAASTMQMPASAMRPIAARKPSETVRSRVGIEFMVGPIQNENCTAAPSICNEPRVL